MALHADYHPVALWDPNPEACRAAAAIAPTAKIMASPEEAIGAASLVYLACPPVPRKAYALVAASANKAVFLEKPLGVDIAQSEELVASLNQSTLR